MHGPDSFPGFFELLIIWQLPVGKILMYLRAVRVLVFPTLFTNYIVPVPLFYAEIQVYSITIS